MLSRLSGLIAALLMLHLTFVGAALSCVEHGGRSAQGHEHAMARHAHPAAGAHAESAAETDRPCDTPVQQGCCHAMTSCAMSAAFAQVAGTQSVPPIRDAIAAAIMRAPRSPITAPDPPPPKA
jgi:hypothetical protein